MANAVGLDAGIPAPYGWVVGNTGGAGTWDVLWSDGAVTNVVATADLLELVPEFKVTDLLGKAVRPSASCSPERAGIVVLQSNTDVLLVESPSGVYAISRNLVEAA